MLEDGWIEELDERPDPELDDERRRYYCLSALGGKVASQILLCAYPAAFRARFPAEMAQVFHSLCYDVYANSGISGLIGVWLPAFLDGA